MSLADTLVGGHELGVMLDLFDTSWGQPGKLTRARRRRDCLRVKGDGDR